MNDNLVAISKYLPAINKATNGRVDQFLEQLRQTVQKVKEEDPSLAGCALYDLGLIQTENGYEVKLYFSED